MNIYLIFFEKYIQLLKVNNKEDFYNLIKNDLHFFKDFLEKYP